jgi:hypothetical protein
MKKYALAAFLVAMVPAQAPATVAAAPTGHEIQTGEALLKMCIVGRKVKALSTMCHSYLNGYLDAVMYQDKTGRFCLAAGDKLELPDKVILWVGTHPEYQKKPAPEALGKLLAEKYPCKK